MSKSISSKIEEKILKIVGAKKIYENPHYLTLCKIKNSQKTKPPLNQLFFWKKHYIDKFYYFCHRGNQKKLIIYIHGGAFVSGPIYFHWTYLKKLSKQTGASVIFPIYPKAPNYDYKDCYQYLFKLWQIIGEKYPNYEINVIGDSAGGNIALSFCEQLKQKQMPPIKNIILFSPCLDLSLSNAEIEKLEKDGIDPMLSKKGLKLMYETWSKKIDLKNPIISPLYGDFENIGKITIIVGTDEILYPEAKQFFNLANEKNIDINFYVKEKMHHAFPLHPIKEAKEYFDIVKNML